MVRSLLNPSSYIITMALLSALAFTILAAVPAAASQEAERDFRGFEDQIKRRDMARRELAKGKSYLEDKSYDLARESLTKALLLHEELNDARFFLGLTEYRAGKYALAVAQFKNLYKREPAYPMLCLELARGYLALTECQDAQMWLKNHLNREKKNKESDKLKRAINKCIKDQEKRH